MINIWVIYQDISLMLPALATNQAVPWKTETVSDSQTNFQFTSSKMNERIEVVLSQAYYNPSMAQ